MIGGVNRNGRDLDEDLAIEEFCSSKDYKGRMDILDLFLKISSQKPTLSSNSSEPEEAHNFYIKREFTSSDPPTILQTYKLFRLIWRSKLTRYFNLIYFIYISLKMFLMTYFHLQFDRIQELIIKKTANDPIRTDNCRIPNQLDEVVSDLERQIEDTRQWLEWVGDPWMSSLGGTTISYLIPVWNWVIFYWIVLVGCEFNRWSIEQIGFMMNPRAVRSALQKQLDYLATKLIRTITFYKISYEGFSSSLQFRDHRTVRTFVRERDYYRTTKLVTKSVPGRVQITVQRLDLIKQFLKTDYWNLVNPIVYSLEWLKTISLITKYTLLVIWLIGIIFWLIGTTYWQLNEFRAQAQARLIGLECRNWNPLAVPIYSYNRPGELNSAEVEAYKECDGSMYSLIWYGISIESKYFLSYRKILTLVEIGLNLPFIVLNAIICIIEFSVGILEKLQWLEQIRRQIGDCYDKCMLEQIDQDEQEQRQLMELSMAAYLNYSLFLSRFEPFRRTATMFITQIFSQTIPVLLCVYYLSTNYGRVVNIAWYSLLIIYISLLCNFFLVCYALVIRKARQVSKLILKLTAASSQINFRSQFTQASLNLWQRQILEDRQLVNIFGLKFLGVGVTLSKIGSFNFYVLGLAFIVVFRNSST